MKKFVVIHNKNSRGRKFLKKEIEELFEKNDLVSDVYQTEKPSEVEEIIK